MDRLRPWLIWWATVAITAWFSSLYLHGRTATLLDVVAIASIVVLGIMFVTLLRHRPRLEWDSPESADMKVGETPAHIAYARIRNRPKTGREPIYAVTATLKYSDEASGNVRFPLIMGRWSHLKRLDDVVESSAHRRITLEGDGYFIRVEVAASLDQSSELFVIDDQQKFRQLSDRSLGSDPVIVDVRIQGATSGRRVDESKCFRLTGRQDGITIEPL